MTVGNEFLAFRSAYIIPQAKISDISYRYRRITKQLNMTFRGHTSETLNSRYLGSYGRDTAAVGLSDLDIGYLLPSDVYWRYQNYVGNGQSALLQALRQSISQTYPLTSVAGDGQVVVTSFSDGMRFEVLPVFDNAGGTWTHPNANKGGFWETCNPKAEQNAIESESHTSNRNLKHLSRMMRVWKNKWAVPISGFLIDTLAYNFIRNWPNKSQGFNFHDWMARDFFSYISSQPSNQTYWLAPGSRAQVWTTGNFQKPAMSSLTLAIQAVAADQAGQGWTRRQRWREVFGTKYPTA